MAKRTLLSLILAVLPLLAGSGRAAQWAGSSGMGLGRYQVTMTALPDGRILAAGGVDQSGAPLRRAEIYDPIKRTWAAAANMNRPRARHTATLLKTGQVLVIGGYDGVTSLASAELYNPDTNTWSLTDGNLNYGRYRHSATFRPLDGTVVVIGGFSDALGILNTTEIYDPETKTFSLLADTSLTARYDHAAVLLSDQSSILVAGGIVDLLGDPTAGAQKLTGSSWSSAGTMPSGNKHAGATATLLPDGTVVVVGGSKDTAGSSTEKVERYNGGTSWSAGVDLPSPRKFHTAALLPNGTLVISGGFGANFVKTVSLAASNDGGSASASSGDMAFTPDCNQPPNSPPCSGLALTGGAANISFTNLATTEEISGALMVSALNVTNATMATSSVTVTGLTTAANDLPPNVSIAGGKFVASVFLTLTGGSVATSTYPILSPIDVNGAALTPVTGSLQVYQAIYSDTLIGTGSIPWTYPSTRLTNPTFFPSSVILPGGSLMVCGGIDNTGVAVNTCSTYRADHGPFSAVTAATAQRQSHTATMLPNGTVLIAGGDDGTNLLNSAAISSLNPTTGDVTGFSATGSMNCTRKNHTATLLQSGSVMVCGGLTNTVSTFCGGAATPKPTASCELFSGGTWTQWTPMNDARVHHTATLLFTGQVLMAGGLDTEGAALSSVELYDAYLQNWTQTTPLALARYQHTASLLQDGRVMVAGGRKLEPIGVSETFDPTKATWTSAAMTKKRYLHNAAFTLDGRVIVTGGLDIFGFPIADAEAYEASGNRWSGLSSLAQRHSEHNGTLLPNGKVIITGGATLFDATLSTTTIEVLEGSGWTTYIHAGQNRMAAKRKRHTSTLLNNGKVLLVGGWNGTGVENTYESGYLSEFPLSGNVNAPAITAISTGTVSPGDTLTLTGTKFTAVSESGGGMNYTAAGVNYPRVIMRPYDSGNSGTQTGSSFVLDASTSIYKSPWSDTSLSFTIPPGRGYYQVAVQAGGMTSFFTGVLINPVDVPSSTTAISGTPLGISSVAWSWTSVPFSTSYDVLRASDDQVLTNVTSQSYIQTGLTPNSAAPLIKVRGVGTAGTGPKSAASPTVYTLAVAPSTPTVVYGTSKAMKLTWSANGNPTGTSYRVQIARNLGYDIGLVEATTTSLELRLEGTQPLTTYYGRVQAINKDNKETAFSASTQTLTSLGDIIDTVLDRTLTTTVSTLLSSNRTVVATIQPETFHNGANLVIEDSTFTPCGVVPAAVKLTVTPDEQPARAVLLTLKYLTADVVSMDQSRLQFMRYDEDSGTCVPLRSAVDTSSKTVTALLDHFSVYQIALSTPAADLSSVSAWPNPMRPNRPGETFITFKPLPAGAEVQIYTMRGELVYTTTADASGTASWHGVNRSGLKSASGVYIVLLKNGGSTKTIKVAIER